ncbi:hypothetical protein C8J56DRAFT_28684 [Mycena floridula]|nr:hypothetical protein C8J56DRAFT_28684 [Mycena floridula]
MSCSTVVNSLNETCTGSGHSLTCCFLAQFCAVARAWYESVILPDSAAKGLDSVSYGPFILNYNRDRFVHIPKESDGSALQLTILSSSSSLRHRDGLSIEFCKDAAGCRLSISWTLDPKLCWLCRQCLRAAGEDDWRISEKLVQSCLVSSSCWHPFSFTLSKMIHRDRQSALVAHLLHLSLPFFATFQAMSKIHPPAFKLEYMVSHV